MQQWKILGIIATLIMVLALPFYGVQRSRKLHSKQQPAAGATFVTSASCARCHKREYEEWKTSHHARSMAVATEETVLGDFADAVFTKQGIDSRFYQRDGRFFVYTQGPEGKMAEFEITHTFGWYPLQQYLIPFPGGRMQCLPIAWDVREKKWFHLYPKLELDSAEWIYWTNQAQNWNSMCADCHSTELQKNYDPLTATYDTRWAEISVGCEACHGPGSLHISWAELPEMARSEKENGLLVKTSGISNQQQVELCAPCHSRRSMLGDYTHQQQRLLDTEIPRLLEEGLYYPDGQILDEVYVYGSFVQSKMYAHDVRCSDCHNVHTIKLHRKGNKLCLQCHQAALYDTKAHHFHKQNGETGEAIRSSDGEILFDVGSGAECVQCHMPGRLYMVNDYRPDHSIRIPRPDLSITLGTPNSCNRCHRDKSNEWSAGYTRKWYGSKQKYQYGTTFKLAREGKLEAKKDLIRIVCDPLASTLVRATALSLLGSYQGNKVAALFRWGLVSDKDLLRRTALLYLPRFQAAEKMEMVGPLLNDPVKGVRIEAARVLTWLPADQITSRYRKSFAAALAEFEKTALYSADFSASRQNLGALASFQGRTAKAEEHFLKAVAINRDFFMARINLAVLYSKQGKNDLAEEQLRKALAVNPDLPDVHYSLGLLLSEKKQYNDAVEHLARAAADMPGNARVYYNLGQLLAFLGRNTEAEKALQHAVKIDPGNLQYLQALARFYLGRGEFIQAEDVAKQMTATNPENPLGEQLRQYINSMNK